MSQFQRKIADGRIMLMQNSSDTIGNRIRDLPTCSAVPQPTAPLCTLFTLQAERNLMYTHKKNMAYPAVIFREHTNYQQLDVQISYTVFIPKSDIKCVR
jgi:hypothetical protein